MAKKQPKRPEDIYDELLADISQALGTDLISLCVFGSAARGAYQPGQSDINLLVEVADQSRRPHSRLSPVIDKWQPAGVAPPVVMSSRFLRTSADVFPLELLTMAGAHQCLHGPDPLADFDVDREHLRLQLEREVKAKRISLGTRMMTSGGKQRALVQIAVEAAPAVKALLQGWLWLAAREMPHDWEELAAACRREGLKVDALEKLRMIRGGGMKPRGDELLPLLEQAEDELAELGRRLDAM